MPDQNTDQHFMQRALDLASQGIGLASPNPCVGAVLVDDSSLIVGTGTHTYDGIKHAEVLALEQAGEKARGSTLYINLEPCSHHGRTPPCVDALIAAGVRRVVASMNDPNPSVSGRGFEKLRRAGMVVEVGAMAEQARRVNESFATYIRRKIPFVTLKSAMTLNGKIAPASATPVSATPGIPTGGWITGEASRQHVHRLRHENDALLIGVGTVLADDPLLTDRSGLPRRRRLLRVVFDSHLRLPVESRLARRAQNGDVLVFCTAPPLEKQAGLKELGIRVEKVSEVAGRIDWQQVLRRLGQLEITSLMVEGGSQINGSAFAAGIVDKVFLYYAPKIFFDSRAVSFGTGNGAIGDPIAIQSLSFHRFGEDFAVEGYIRDPYRN